ncbi:MAG: GldG family protein [Spirochaetes bacterium]|nr:GldG family protein [Spirochaetota bacterium]
MHKKTKEIIIVVLVLLIFIFIGLNSTQFFTRLDLTANKVFTISKVSRKLFTEIPDQVHITYFVSDKLRQLYTFPGRIEDMLNEYAAYSHGKIIVNIVDPAKSGDTSRAQGLGVYPQQIEVVEKDQRSVAMVYSGLVIQYLDRHETLPAVTRTNTLEYELTSKIKKVVTNEHKKIGIIVGSPQRNYNQDYGLLTRQLSQQFEVQEIKKGKTIPGDISVLFVIGNGSFDNFDLFPVDQYLMNGGKVLFLVDGVNVDMRNNLKASKINKSPMLDMLKSYGIDVKREMVLDKYSKDFRIPRQIFGQTMWQVLGKYPEWITISSQSVAKDNPITARFSGLDLYWASPLKWIKRSGEKAEPIIKTTKDAWVMKKRFLTNPYQASTFAYIGGDTKGQYNIGYTVTGTFHSYFAGKSIPVREGESRDWKEIKDKSAETRIIVIGDSDFVSNLLQYTGANYNLDFAENSAEWLSHGEDLLSIKTRIIRDTRLNKIQDIKKRVTVMLFSQIVNIIFIPLLVIAFGIFRFLARRKKRLTSMEQED